MSDTCMTIVMRIMRLLRIFSSSYPRYVPFVLVIAVHLLLSNAIWADSFSDELQFLEEQDVQSIGLDAAVAGYEELLQAYPDHPSRSKAMLLLASLCQITNPELGIKPDTELEIRWLREAAVSSPEGSPEWFEARFRLSGQIRQSKPKEAKEILREIVEHAPGPVIEVKALYQLQMLASRLEDLEEAERICGILQLWDVDRENLPDSMYDKGQVFSWMQWSALSMMMDWAEMHVPKSERMEKIKTFGDKFQMHMWTQGKQEEALAFLEILSDIPRPSDIALDKRPKSKWSLWLNVVVIAAIISLLLIRKLQKSNND